MRFLLQDRDLKFPASFAVVFARRRHGGHSHTVSTPNANAEASRGVRGVRGVREECLDHLLSSNERHLDHVLREYSQYYNQARPHQGSSAADPPRNSSANGQGSVQRRDILGGLIHDYHREAA